MHCHICIHLFSLWLTLIDESRKMIFLLNYLLSLKLVLLWFHTFFRSELIPRLLNTMACNVVFGTPAWHLSDFTYLIQPHYDKVLFSTPSSQYFSALFHPSQCYLWTCDLALRPSESLMFLQLTLLFSCSNSFWLLFCYFSKILLDQISNSFPNKILIINLPDTN